MYDINFIPPSVLILRVLMCLQIDPKNRSPTSWKNTSRIPLSVLPWRSFVCVCRQLTAALAVGVGSRSAFV